MNHQGECLLVCVKRCYFLKIGWRLIGFLIKVQACMLEFVKYVKTARHNVTNSGYSTTFMGIHDNCTWHSRTLHTRKTVMMSIHFLNLYSYFKIFSWMDMCIYKKWWGCCYLFIYYLFLVIYLMQILTIQRIFGLQGQAYSNQHCDKQVSNVIAIIDLYDAFRWMVIYIYISLFLIAS